MLFGGGVQTPPDTRARANLPPGPKFMRPPPPSPPIRWVVRTNTPTIMAACSLQQASRCQKVSLQERIKKKLKELQVVQVGTVMADLCSKGGREGS